LLQRDYVLACDADGGYRVSGGDGSPAKASVAQTYGLLWLCPGDPVREIVSFPPFEDPRYQTVLCGPYGVGTSAPRIIENFLDMAHFPFVHPGILGLVPKTEVAPYKVESDLERGLIATECSFWQPEAIVLAHGGTLVRYEYRVPRPLTAILTKLPDAPGGNSVSILLTVQPVEPESSKAWILFAVTNKQKSALELRAHQERIFMQDKPILENQQPKRLPLDPKAEYSLPCDRLSMAYRRYLSEVGLRFGAIPKAVR
jgi:phenylpropionate dioxygenase-like ring-hydroxylating dioxygenase large terminal subunit